MCCDATDPVALEQLPSLAGPCLHDCQAGSMGISGGLTNLHGCTLLAAHVLSASKITRRYLWKWTLVLAS